MSERIISKYGRFFAVIRYDDCAENPRVMFDHDTTIVYHSHRYILGDKDIAPDDFELPENVWAFPVYAYIHSGIALSISSSLCAFDPQGWDSGQSGIIYVSKDICPDEDAAYRLCKADIDEFSAWHEGDVYGYTIYRVPDDADPEEVSEDECEELDSCWSFYGYRLCEKEVRHLLDEYEKEPRQLSLLEV